MKTPPVDSKMSSNSDDKKTYRLLILTKEYDELLWIKSLLHQSKSINWQIHWQQEASACFDVFNHSRFDAILCDFGFSLENPLTFISYLLVESDYTPIISIGSAPESVAAPQVFQAGGMDYLCKGFLSDWALEKAILYSHFRHQSEKKVNQRSERDNLTGIVNRNLFFDRLRHSLQGAKRSRSIIAIAIINIDNFSRINDNLGYQYGDQLIRLVSTRIERTLRKSDSIARIAGDEFAIVLENIEDLYACNSIAEKLMDLFVQPFSIEHDAITISASIGIASYPQNAQIAEDLFKYANRAMRDAKADHGNSYRYYNQKMNAELNYNLQLESEFRLAIRSNQLRLFYQPRIDIANNEIIGMECLIRWEHPERGLLAPDAFIGLAEKTGMIVPMGYWVIDQACRDLAKLQTKGYCDLTSAVNLSFRQFHDKKLTETVFRIIYNSGVNASNLEFELTESSMMHDIEHTRRCLQDISQMGISFSLDDFGTGFSSFSTLQELPISTLKIDKSFVGKIEHDVDSRVIVNAVISLAHNLQMNVVAEGVENEPQLSFLQYHHCDQVQGYYFGKPVPFAEFLGVLKKYYPQEKRSESQKN